MGIFKRVRDIFTANIKSMLDQAEDPEAMINQIIRELEVTISDLKCSCAGKIADKKTLIRKSEDLTSSAERWGKRAESAVKAGKDGLAKEALKEKSILTEKIGSITRDLDSFDSNIEMNKEQILKLEQKLTEMISRKKELLSRVNRAQEKNDTNNIINKITGEDLLEKFSRFENKIERMEAEAEIFGSSLESEFEEMEQNSKIDEELEVLKKKVKNSN